MGRMTVAAHSCSMSSGHPSVGRFRFSRERALAMALAAIIAVITLTGVLVFKHGRDDHVARSNAPAATHSARDGR
jgi:hypothetical protein